MMGLNGNFQVFGRQGAAQTRVTSAIQQASARTGVDFGYLVQQAQVESSLNPNAQARTSSATGLYQFVDQTWLRMMKTHGAEHGYGQMADAIRQDRNGNYSVPGHAMRNRILNLRKDPQAASLMAASLACENNSYLQQATGSTPSSTDLYMAHFMGAQGASNFLNAMKKNPWAPAASMFPEAARANRGVFYAQGRPLTLQQVYNNFDAKFAGSGDTPVAGQTQVAAAAFRPVVLPQADDWSNPDTGTGTGAQIAASALSTGAGNTSGIRALTRDISQNDTVQSASQSDTMSVADAGGYPGFVSGLGSRVSWPMDAVLNIHAHMRDPINDESRYNA